MTARSQQAIVCQLLSHVLAHPGASDAIDGIARWWLDPTDWVDMNELNDALEDLVERGLFAVHDAADGRRRYRRCGNDAALQAHFDWLQGDDGRHR